MRQARRSDHFHSPDNCFDVSVGCGWQRTSLSSVQQWTLLSSDQQRTSLSVWLRRSFLGVHSSSRSSGNISAGSVSLQRDPGTHRYCSRGFSGALWILQVLGNDIYWLQICLACVGSTLATLLGAQIHTPLVLSFWRHLPLGAHLKS